MFNFLSKLLSPVKPPARIEPLPPLSSPGDDVRFIVATYREIQSNIEHRHARLMMKAQQDRAKDLWDNREWTVERLTELGLSSDEISALLSGRE